MSGEGIRTLVEPCHVRAAQSQPGQLYQNKLKQLSADIFSDGIPCVTFDALKAPPHDGVLITSSSEILLRSGLLKGDIIVALDGYRVQNDQQYECILHFTRDPKMDLIVWRKNQYKEINAEVKDRYLGAWTASYKSK
jgi:hypothetical protein